MSKHTTKRKEAVNRSLVASLMKQNEGSIERLTAMEKQIAELMQRIEQQSKEELLYKRLIKQWEVAYDELQQRRRNDLMKAEQRVKDSIYVRDREYGNALYDLTRHSINQAKRLMDSPEPNTSKVADYYNTITRILRGVPQDMRDNQTYKEIVEFRQEMHEYIRGEVVLDTGAASGIEAGVREHHGFSMPAIAAPVPPPLSDFQATPPGPAPTPPQEEARKVGDASQENVTPGGHQEGWVGFVQTTTCVDRGRA